MSEGKKNAAVYVCAGKLQVRLQGINSLPQKRKVLMESKGHSQV